MPPWPRMAHRRRRGDDHHIGQAAQVRRRRAWRPAATPSTPFLVKRNGSWCSAASASPGQWGIPYQKDLEIGRTPMTLGKTKAPVENVTISIDDTPKGATLRVEWGTASATAPFHCRLMVGGSWLVVRGVLSPPTTNYQPIVMSPVAAGTRSGLLTSTTLRFPSSSLRNTIRSQPCMLVGVYLAAVEAQFVARQRVHHDLLEARTLDRRI